MAKNRGGVLNDDVSFIFMGKDRWRERVESENESRPLPTKVFLLDSEETIGKNSI